MKGVGNRSGGREEEEFYEVKKKWICILPQGHNLFLRTDFFWFRCRSVRTSVHDQSTDAETLDELCKVSPGSLNTSRGLGKAREAHTVVLDLPCKCF